MKTVFGVACAVVALALAGCSREEQPRRQTLTEVEAKIASVQNDPNIPSNVKPMILGNLEGQRQSLLRHQSRK
jgi:hypothetical protein